MYHHGELTLQAHQIPCTLLFDRLTIVNVVHPRKKSVKVENNAYTFIEKKPLRTRRKFSTMELAKIFGQCFFFLATVCLFIFFRCCFCWCCFGRYGNLRKRNTKKEWRARAHFMLHWITEIPVCNMTYDKSYDGINVYPGEAKKCMRKRLIRTLCVTNHRFRRHVFPNHFARCEFIAQHQREQCRSIF